MRGSRAGLALVLVGTGLALGVTGPASASCVGPQLELNGTQMFKQTQPVDVQRSDPLHITGRFFSDGCDDTGGAGGCSGPVGTAMDGVRPAKDVELRLVQGARSWSLGTTDATEAYTVDFQVELPADVAPGPAELVASTPVTGEARLDVIVGD